MTPIILSKIERVTSLAQQLNDEVEQLKMLVGTRPKKISRARQDIEAAIKKAPKFKIKNH